MYIKVSFLFIVKKCLNTSYDSIQSDLLLCPVQTAKNIFWKVTNIITFLKISVATIAKYDLHE